MSTSVAALIYREGTPDKWHKAVIISADSRQTRLKGETNDGKMIELSLKGQREKMVDLIENIGDRKKKLFRYTVGSFNVAVALLGDPAEAKTKIGVDLKQLNKRTAIITAMEIAEFISKALFKAQINTVDSCNNLSEFKKIGLKEIAARGEGHIVSAVVACNGDGKNPSLFKVFPATGTGEVVRVEQINQGANIRAIDRFTVTAGIGHHDMRGSLTTNLMMARNGGHLDDTDGPLLSPVLARQWMDCTAEAAFDSKENIDKLFSNNESNNLILKSNGTVSHSGQWAPQYDEEVTL